MKLIMHGAEAKIYLDTTVNSKSIIKKIRVKKNYRIKELDESIRKQRTNREAKILKKLSNIGFTPQLLKTNNIDSLEMSYINGKKLSQYLEILDYISISNEIGKKIKQLHDLEIIHGDLTTSNMIFANAVYIIDFGLSFTSSKTEDKAVDLHLLKEALESRHHTIAKKCFNEVLNSYNDPLVEHRLKLVESRGRNKNT